MLNFLRLLKRVFVGQYKRRMLRIEQESAEWEARAMEAEAELARVTEQRDHAWQQVHRILELVDTCYSASVDISYEPEPDDAPGELPPDSSAWGNVRCAHVANCPKLLRGGKCCHDDSHPWDSTCKVSCFYAGSRGPTCAPITADNETETKQQACCPHENAEYDASRKTTCTDCRKELDE
jgi:hypothetical protein